MVCYLLYALGNLKNFTGQFIRHPLVLILFLHLGWMLVTVVNSEIFVVSLKFFIAKLWYVVTFVFVTALFMRKEKDIKLMIWIIFIPLTIATFQSFIRQYLNDFAFDQVHFAMKPTFRNHVSYAAILALFIPFMWFGRHWYKPMSFKWNLLVGGILFYLVAIYFSYTRAAYIAVFLSAASYFVIHFRLMKISLALGTIIAVAFIGSLFVNNAYLEYAPNFESTIMHTEFDDLLAATYNLEDISTMERAYRWVAAGFMVKDKPIMGFGPGNFYNFYKEYTVTSFTTYVSDNEDRSGLHNYYFMILVDQGLFGFILFMVLIFAMLIIGERVYHESPTESRKNLLLMVLLSTIVIDVFLLINDMIETDKVGSFFFINLAIIVNLDLANKRDRKKLRIVAKNGVDQ